MLDGRENNPGRKLLDTFSRYVHILWQTGGPFDPHNNPPSYLRKRVGDINFTVFFYFFDTQKYFTIL